MQALRFQHWFWLRGQGAGVRWTPLCKAQKHRPRRQPRPPTCFAQTSFACTLAVPESCCSYALRQILTATPTTVRKRVSYLNRVPFAVPEKIIGLALFLDFFDRGTRLCFAVSRTASAQQRAPTSNARRSHN